MKGLALALVLFLAGCGSVTYVSTPPPAPRATAAPQRASLTSLPTLPPPPADLVTGTITFATEVDPGQLLTISVPVSNTGGRPAAPKLVLSGIAATFASCSGCQYANGSAQFPAIGPGKAVVESMAFRLAPIRTRVDYNLEMDYGGSMAVRWGLSVWVCDKPLCYAS